MVMDHSQDRPSMEEITASGISLSERELEQLLMKDEDFVPFSWARLKETIDANRLEILARNPADTRKRAIWADDINKRYGTVTKFVLKELLRWTPVDPDATRPVFKCHSSIPLSDSRDYQISINNWPYGFEDGIVHLLVWSKPRFKVDEVKGDLIPESRQLVEDFVNRTFIKRLAEDVGEENAKQRVLWFKNWTELQSVPGTDHIHILVKDATPELMKEWTRETSTHD